MEQRWENAALDRLECAGIAKKAGHTDEDILIQGLHLAPMLLQKDFVFADAFEPLQEHPARDPPIQRRRFVVAEIDTGLPLQQLQDFVDSAF